MGQPAFFTYMTMLEHEIISRNINESVENAGFHLLDVQFSSHDTGVTIETYVDSENGITADDCAKISRLLDEIFASKLPESDYHLVVSSPGLDRPLKHLWQFRRHRGRLVSLELAGTLGKLEGRIENVEESVVVIALRDGSTREIPFADIIQANIIVTV